MKKKAVIALGGNALVRKGQRGTIYEQFTNTRKSVKSIVKMIKEGWDVVVTHGNGPQVGAILLQNKVAKDFFLRISLVINETKVIPIKFLRNSGNTRIFPKWAATGVSKCVPPQATILSSSSLKK